MNSFIKVLLILLYCTSLFAIEDLPKLKRARLAYDCRSSVKETFKDGVSCVTWKRLKPSKSFAFKVENAALEPDDISYSQVKKVNILWKLDRPKAKNIIEAIGSCDLNSSDEQIVFDADNYRIFFKRMFFESGSFFNGKPVSDIFELCFKRKYDGLYELDITIDDISLILDFFKLYILDTFEDLDLVGEQDINRLEYGLAKRIFLGY